MRTAIRRLCAALFLSTALPSGAPAQPAAGVRVLSIAPTTGVTRVASGLRTMADIRLWKFADEERTAPAAILAVTWERAPGRAAPGAQLELEYRFDGRDAPRAQRVALPPRERGPRTHRFEIPLTPETGGRVSAWRLRLMHDKTVLEEYTSAAWR